MHSIRVLSSSNDKRAGLTLLELLLVMILMGLLFGAGMGSIASLDLGRRQALGLVQSTLSAARNTALLRRSPARVEFEVGGNRMTACAMSVVGTWHFEDAALRGAFGLDAQAAGPKLVDDGYLGKALRFTDGAAAKMEVDVMRDPAYRFDAGFALELALRPEGSRACSVVDVGRAFGLQMTGTGALRAWFLPSQATQGGAHRPGSHVVVESPPGILSAGRWSRVRVHYDRRSLRLEVDGKLVAELADDTPVYALGGMLVVGSSEHTLQASVDSLVIATWSASESTQLPEGVSFGPETPARVAFDAEGRLERAEHASEVKVVLTYPEQGSEVLRINRLGVIE